MTSKLGYEIVELGTRGKIVVATRDFQPGETVVEEKEPVLLLTAEILKEFKKYDPTDMSMYLAGFVVTVRRMNPVKKATLLTLYGPTTGLAANSVREYASKLQYSPDSNIHPRHLTPDEVEMFVRIASIMRLNMFGGDDVKLIFAEVTRFAHSCASNCAYHVQDNAMYCRTTQRLAAGEELTISYVRERDLEPTHIRRQKYLEMKDFTCHCPRCDAPGDDTRQFDCFDPACNGLMMVCQPISKEEARLTYRSHTAMEYVEPHLLPCTVCHRPAPATYQAKMLALEATLPELVTDIEKRQKELLTRFDLGRDRFERLVKEIVDLKLPMHHQLVVPVLRCLERSSRYQLMDVVMGIKAGDVDSHRAAVHRAVEAYIAAQEAATPGINSNLATVIFQACHDTIFDVQQSRFPLPCLISPLAAKELLQRCLRMKLILRPRDLPREEVIGTALLKVLEDLPPLLSTDLCAFCEESPLCAAITLSRCDRCRKAAYCSAACQKAHWKLHKKTCKAGKK